MSEHSIVEAKNQLSGLIDRALAGETVIITRHGTAVAEIRPVQKVVGPVSKESLEWLRQRREGRRIVGTDAGKLVSEMRDEGDERLFRR
jgi:prevent-host-death family protein